ncbi:MAG TPA: FecR domain-containing protein [Candidatus Xenobia bacterium]|nr:FecR domain-containing protein [Candidatus Xenobia bacterium]
MRKQTGIILVVALVAGSLLVAASPAAAQAKKPAAPAKPPSPPAPKEPQAGKVTAEIPKGQIDRKAQMIPVAVGAEVYWNDIVHTGEKGRARITLLDTSIINIGPQATFRVVIHDEKTKQSELFLIAGKARVQVKKTDPKQKFTLKTDAAVIGVIGTDFFVDAKGDETTITCFDGIVRVRSSDPDVSGDRRLGAGETLTVRRNQPLQAIRPATAEEMDNALKDTDVGPPLPEPTILEARRKNPPAVPAASPSAAPSTPATPGTPAPAAGTGDVWKTGWAAFAKGFSADIVSTAGGRTFRMRMYTRGNISRMEMAEQGQRVITIMRPDRNLAWTLMVDQQMYMEVPLTNLPAEARGDFARAMTDPNVKYETELLGMEQVGGYQCQKMRYRTTYQGQTFSGTAWLATALDYFPIKVVTDQPATTVEYQNIKLGPPDPALFELPPGYRKMTY